jgi:anthranilate phosphoribosyltransferase
VEHREIFEDKMMDLFRQLMTGQLSNVQIAGLLVGLRVKKETVEEISGAARVMREFASKVVVPNPEDLLDIVGTGGDGQKTFNISTTSMFVVGAAGCRVAKHGNRSVSSSSGAADALEGLGANIALNSEQVARCIETLGMGFMFAPNHHPAMRYAAPVRKELGVKTIFNILGPLTSPANAGNILMGVFHEDLVGIQVRVMQKLGAKHAVIVFGRDGLDEVSLGASTLVGDLKDGMISEYEIHPEDFGLKMTSTRNFRVDGPAESKIMMMKALNNEDCPQRDIVIFNSGVALYAGNKVATIADGIALARETIASGAALKKMQEYVAFTQSLKA